MHRYKSQSRGGAPVGPMPSMREKLCRHTGEGDMPPRDNPTVRQARLGGELRKFREHAGKTAREAGGVLATDQARISHIEAGRIGISEDRVRRLATFYACADSALLDALCAITHEHRGQHWWDEYRGVLPQGFLDIAELEHHAVELRYVQPFTLPGILQTADYARTLFDNVLPKLPLQEVDARVEHRMRRQEILDRPAPPPVLAIIHEAALRLRVGGRSVARDQLQQLIEASERPSVMVRVIPFANEDFVEVTQTVLYAHGVVSRLDTVQIDSPFGGLYLDSPSDLDRYGMLLDLAEQASMEPAESRDFIHRIVEGL
jgi:transcriptional regulator with XRE-family HTH domain